MTSLKLCELFFRRVRSRSSKWSKVMPPDRPLVRMVEQMIGARRPRQGMKEVVKVILDDIKGVPEERIDKRTGKQTIRCGARRQSDSARMLF